MHRYFGMYYPEVLFNKAFGYWATRALKKDLTWDVIHVWSGVAEEVLLELKSTGIFIQLIRGSSHVRTQSRILEEEKLRTRISLDRPSPWIIDREEREYALAEQIVVGSTFAYESFLAEGIPAEKVRLLLPGVQVRAFRAPEEIVEQRCRRILANQPLRVFYAGALSLRKGFFDMIQVINRMDPARFRFRLMGTITPEVRSLVPHLRQKVEFVRPQPFHQLPRWFGWGDIFIFPTLEDGYAVMLSLARVTALPILTTPNCQGPDLVKMSQAVWVLPIRSPERFIEQLEWCDQHREELAALARERFLHDEPRSWSDAAADFEKICEDTLRLRKEAPPKKKPLKIAIAVPGRFDSFDLARGLIEQGHEVTLFTNYPGWAVERFGVSSRHSRSFWIHGVLFRINWWLHRRFGIPYPEKQFNESFGRWAAQAVKKNGPWDVIQVWSGVAEEILQELKPTGAFIQLIRGSSHVRTQSRLLEEEKSRTGVSLDRPSSWIIAREEREYALAEQVLVESSFSYNSFLSQGVSPGKVKFLTPGTQTNAFRPPKEVIDARCERILSGEPLQVLYVGALSFRKGFFDVASIIKTSDPARFRFRFVGPMAPEVRPLSTTLRKYAEFIPPQPQAQLGRWYAWGDIFIFPTIEDGYALVLSQARAAALPILTTTNCAGPDLAQASKGIWVLPIRQPEAFIERLRWCDQHRSELAHLIRERYEQDKLRTWTEAATDFEVICRDTLTARHAQ
jgi:glycosyltransferase involved in cell wall biosynthesis